MPPAASLGRDPGAAAEAAGQVETTGRDALREMRRALGVLRAEVGDEAGAAIAARLPQPSLHDVAALVDGYRDAGLDVRLRIDGVARPLPSGVELAAFRIVQEALTNTMKHAGPARAEVRVRVRRGGARRSWWPTTAAGRRSTTPGGDGHGLAGMRERVAALRRRARGRCPPRRRLPGAGQPAARPRGGRARGRAP